jgi:GrpB-like predicted nucleotidyltransferase (UPF0157 family)
MKLKTHLDAILGDFHIKILHIGSTSVEGMYAKPIIDIDIVYKDNFESIKNILIANNYKFKGDLGIKDRYAFTYLKNDFHEHHLYVILEHSEALNNHLDLKNGLIISKHNREKYSQLKRDLIRKNNIDRELYTDSKTTLINKIISEVKL